MKSSKSTTDTVALLKLNLDSLVDVRRQIKSENSNFFLFMVTAVQTNRARRKCRAVSALFLDKERMEEQRRANGHSYHLVVVATGSDNACLLCGGNISGQEKRVRERRRDTGWEPKQEDTEFK